MIFCGKKVMLLLAIIFLSHIFYHQVGAVKETAIKLCQDLGPHALSLCDAFAITDTMLSAPIALDWVQYNTYDNQGELMSQKEFDENVTLKK